MGVKSVVKFKQFVRPKSVVTKVTRNIYAQRTPLKKKFNFGTISPPKKVVKQESKVKINLN